LLVTGQHEAPPLFLEVDADALGEGTIIDSKSTGRKPVSLVACGRVTSDTRIVIADPDTMVSRPPDVVGEIWISSPSVAQGYWRRENETARIFGAYLADGAEGPFLRTGDLGFCRDGQLFVTGRIKDVINIRGFKHYPQDIELTMAASHEAIHSSGCAAFAVTHDGVEQLAVIAEMRPRFQQRDSDASGLDKWQDCVISAIQDSVADRHGLRIHAGALVAYGTIPKTTSGKLQRYACRRSFIDGSLQAMRVWSLSV
jgi:acyl-CoA synthetase (AMP-forming)/AMP-acid ligase II